ncbi:MAG: CHRD domain-containing protein [Bradyrhizobium sp.]
MNAMKLALTIGVAGLLATSGYVTAGNAAARKGVPADKALSGVPLAMTPDQLPSQFRTQLRGDVKSSKGTAVLHRKGKDVAYTFAWDGLTSSVISGHFHTAPQGQVGVRGYSICGVAGESPPCPKGKSGRISGVWKNADIDAIRRGDITIAFHTEVYPAPIGEIAAYIPASK